MDQVQRRLKHTLWPHIPIVAIYVGAVALLAACSNITPQNTVAPAPSPTLAQSASALRAATPASGKPFRASSALLSPADLTFDETYPATGWQRCDDYSVDRNLERFRAAYRVAGSAAAIWEYGTGCGSTGQRARLDEYAWLLQDDSAASELSSALIATSYFDNVTPTPGNRVRQFERDSVVVRTLALESNNGKPLYAAEIIGQAGSTVALMRMTTDTALTDENYLGLVQLCLGRLHAGQGAQ